MKGRIKYIRTHKLQFTFYPLIYINCLKLLFFTRQSSFNPFFNNTSLIQRPIRAVDHFYNPGDALLMAKYGAALMRLGFLPSQIGFIVPRFLDAQASVLFCLLRHKFQLPDEELDKLAIGSEYIS